MLKKLQLFCLSNIILFSCNVMGKESETCLKSCISRYAKCIRPTTFAYSSGRDIKITDEEKIHLMSYLKASSINFAVRDNKLYAIAEFNNEALKPKEISIIQICQDERKKCKFKCEE